jgi:UDP-N-acetylmuramoylalanine--D-glutamate ligase
MEISDLKGKKIALLGMGLENIYLADFLLENEITDIELRDQKDLLEIGESVPDDARELFNQILSRRLKHLFGNDYLSGLNNFDLIFRTPGLPYLTPEIQGAKESGVEISSQMKLFFDLCPAKIIGVTGTKGKGSTSTLISEILKGSKANNPNLSSDIYLLGNIGQAAVNHLRNIKENDLVILELSSFQLQDMDKSPYISVITNLGEDHLNYHKDLEEYWGSKVNIVKYQTASDYAILNQDFLTSFEIVSQTDAKVYYFSGKNSVEDGAFVKDDGSSKQVILKLDTYEEVICRSDELNIVGDHNLENIAAATIVAKICGVQLEQISKAVKDFKGLEHRLEYVAEIGGVKFFNDSFATNPVATLAAIRAFQQPLVLVLGGSEKNLDYLELINEIKGNQFIKSIVYIGETGNRLACELKNLGYEKVIPGGDSMSEIVKVAKDQAESDDVVLLSPASASFGLFKNYKERGDQFKQAVNQLQENSNIKY